MRHPHLLWTGISPASLKMLLLLSVLCLPSAAVSANSQVGAALQCPSGWFEAGGKPDTTLFSTVSAKGIRAEWCERYTDAGTSIREGVYREFYANGALHVEATYADSRLVGRVAAFHENGQPFLRGTLRGGAWNGRLQLYHVSGRPWLELRYAAGKLDGPSRIHHADGSIASEATFQKGREDGLARSYYPIAAGGRIYSEVHVEADRFVGTHRLFAPGGELLRSLDWNDAPIAWLESDPAKSRPAAPAPADD